jgi:predicted small lipoprotein YifL
MKKTLTLILAALTLVLALTGCAAGEKAPAVKDIPSADVYAALEGKYEYPSVMAMDDTLLADFYGVDPAKCTDYTVMMPMMNVKATEIAIFRLKDAADAPAFAEACAARAEAVAASFEFYLQDQYEVAKAPQIKTVGNYVLMIIFEEAEAMMKTVEETLAQ